MRKKKDEDQVKKEREKIHEIDNDIYLKQEQYELYL